MGMDVDSLSGYGIHLNDIEVPLIQVFFEMSDEEWKECEEDNDYESIIGFDCYVAKGGNSYSGYFDYYIFIDHHKIDGIEEKAKEFRERLESLGIDKKPGFYDDYHIW